MGGIPRSGCFNYQGEFSAGELFKHDRDKLSLAWKAFSRRIFFFSKPKMITFDIVQHVTSTGG